MEKATILGVCRRHWLLTIVLGLAVGILSWAIFSVAPFVRYSNMSARIRDKIYDLRTELSG